ncbi:MAG: orotidine-5'-phosphate decarboxylase [Terriglobales bacterium]
MESTSPEVTVARIAASDRLILALDVPAAEQAMRFVTELDGLVSFFKVGLELYTAVGSSVVKELIKGGKKVFLDLKYFDVPETVQRAVEVVASMDVNFLTIHGNGKIVRAAVKGRGTSALKLLAVTALTSLDDDDMDDLGLSCTVRELVAYRARKALEAGCDGVITSPEEANTIRQLAGEAKMTEEFLIVTPGIRPSDSSRDDHKRYSTPFNAIQQGADFLVVGRPIRNSANPRQAAEKIIAEMQQAFDAR